MAKTSGKVRNERVSTETFIRAWESSTGVQEVSQKTGMKTPTAQARASKQRAAGIPLKHMPKGGGAKLDVKAAQALVAQLRSSVKAENAN